MSQILQSANDLEFDVVVYCLMPDHAHLLLFARSEASDFIRCVKQIKQVTGFYHRQATGRRLWQPGYHERILRDDEATLAVARYILENPVRAGLAKALGEWPLAGSGVYTWPELFSAWATRRPKGLHYDARQAEGLHYDPGRRSALRRRRQTARLKVCTTPAVTAGLKVCTTSATTAA